MIRSPTFFSLDRRRESGMSRTFEALAAKAADPMLLAGRLLLALIFVHEAISLTIGFGAAATVVSKVGIPPAGLVLVILMQFGAGLMVGSGWHARLASLALGLFCLATAFLFHSNLSARNELLHFEKDLAIAGGLFVLAAAGAGSLTVERLFMVQRRLESVG
jgi:putative oxidoreductase